MFRTVPPPPQRLLIFARLPEAGGVKTRLAAVAGEERTLRIYRAMLRDLLDGIGPSSVETEVEVLWAPSNAAGGEFLRRAFGDRTLAMQTGESLGDRLAMAFSERFFFQQTEKIIAIGVDDPLLPRSLVDRAFLLLDSCDWVIGPATDGGYYLIGCRAGSFDHDVFAGVEWGTSSVLRTTIDTIARWKSSVAILPRRSDIDVLEDLERYASEGHGGALGELLGAP